MSLPLADFRFLGLIFLAVCLYIFPGCDDETNTQDASVDPARAGTPLESVSKKFVEDKVGLSSDGSRLVFVSGKDSPAEGPFQFKAFYVDWGDAPGAPSRLTASEGEELDVALAGNGSRAMVLISAENQTDVHIVTPGDTATLVQVTSNTNREKSLAISTDGAMGAFVTTQANGSGVVTVVNFGDGSAASFQKKELSASNYTEVYFVPGSTYQLVLVARDLLTFTATISTLAFTATTDLDDANNQQVLSGVNYESESLVASATNFLWVSREDGRTAVNALGNFEYADGVVTDKAFKQTYVAITDLAGTSTNRFKTDFGYRVKDLSVNQAGDFGFSVVNFVNRCFGSEAAVYGQAMIQRQIASSAFYTEGDATADTTAQVKAIQDLSGAKSFAESYCAPKPSGEAEETTEPTEPTPKPSFDNRVEGVVVNGAATVSDFRLAYVTRLASAFFSNCVQKIADTEIRLVAVAAGAPTFSSLLSPENRASVTDETPAGGSCP